jgi:glycosyltransferase involved in cell wall biosynthesis
MISVVVPTWNEEKMLDKCLASLKKQDVEIIVVDGHSTDGTIKIAEKYADKILFDNKKGLSAARNLGANNASYDIIAFTDGDTIVSKNWAQAISEGFSDRRLVGLGGVVKPLDGSWWDRVVYKWNADLWYRFSTQFGFHQLTGNNCAYRKGVFDRMQFNESLNFLEDTDFSLRVSKLGKVDIDKKIVVYSSTRRFKQKGYLATWFKFLFAYTKYFMDMPLENDYFSSISKL